MQLSAGGGRDSTAPTKPTKSTDRTDGSEGDGCVDSAGGTLSTGATSACISFCCSPSTVEELQRGRRAARGLKSIGVQRSRLLLHCVFYICPSQGGGKHFYHHLGFGQNRALQGRERDKTALWVQNTHNVTEDKIMLKVWMYKGPFCVCSHRGGHWEDKFSRQQNQPPLFWFHQRSDRGCRHQRAHVGLTAPAQLSSTQTCWTRSRSKNQTGKTFLSVDVRRKPDRHHHQKEQTDSWAEWLTDIQQPAAVRPAQCLTQCDSVTALTAAADQCNVKLLVS